MTDENRQTKLSEDAEPLPTRIRKMDPTDLERVKEIDRLSFSQPWPLQSFQFEMTNNPVARLWVAETISETGNSIVCGMLVAWLVIDEAHIGTIAVHPDYRRRRIGSRLLRHSLAQLQKEGASRVYLEVRRSNTGAKEMYRRYGFYLNGIRKGYYQDNGEDALILVLDHLQTRNFS